MSDIFFFEKLACQKNKMKHCALKFNSIILYSVGGPGEKKKEYTRQASSSEFYIKSPELTMC